MLKPTFKKISFSEGDPIMAAILTPYGWSDEWMRGKLSPQNIPLDPVFPPQNRQLLVSKSNSSKIDVATMAEFPNFITSEHILVVNTTATIPARLFPVSTDKVIVDIAQRLDGEFLIRLTPEDDSIDFSEGDSIEVSGGATIILKKPKEIINIPGIVRYFMDLPVPPQMWTATINLPAHFTGSDRYLRYLNQYGGMITYGIVNNKVWDRESYQSVFSKLYPLDYEENAIWGAPEAPTASLGFTPEIVGDILTKGIGIVPILLQNGVTGTPMEEFVNISEFAVQLLNQALRDGKKIISIGTTVARGLYSAYSEQTGQFEAIRTHTTKLIEAATPIPYIDGILTTIHEPRESHMKILRALAGDTHMRACYYYYRQNSIKWDLWGAYHLITR